MAEETRALHHKLQNAEQEKLALKSLVERAADERETDARRGGLRCFTAFFTDMVCSLSNSDGRSRTPTRPRPVPPVARPVRLARACRATARPPGGRRARAHLHIGPLSPLAFSALPRPGAVMPCVILRPIVCVQSPPRACVIVPANLRGCWHRSAQGLAKGVAQCGTHDRPAPRCDEAA